MKKFIRINSLILIMIISAVAIQAQNNNNSKTSNPVSPDTATHRPMSKYEKTQTDADNYIKMADAAKTRLRVLFPSKAGDTVYTIIAGISYTDPNLKLLKQKLDDIKSTKGLTSSYHNNTVVIKIIYKDGNASKLYDNLNDEIKELFMIEDMEGSRMILSYKLAKLAETQVEKNQ